MVFVWVFLKKLNFAANRKAKPLRSKSSSSTANVAKKHPKGCFQSVKKLVFSQTARGQRSRQDKQRDPEVYRDTREGSVAR